MARPNYGPADHCQFNYYPKKIRLVVGQKLASESSFKKGQAITLQQTSKSGVQQGDKIVGEELPKKAMIYTDTGDDSSFILKIEYYGWGEFYLQSSEDDYYRLQITKGMSLFVSGWDSQVDFETFYDGLTKIPVTEEMNDKLGVTVSQTLVPMIEPDPAPRPDTVNENRTTWDDRPSPSDDEGGGGDGGDGTDYCDEDGVIGCYNGLPPNPNLIAPEKVPEE